ncbi:PREDICTED: protein D3-like [Branchiostoma belcheri]|uniref:Protein D3-like n=1 Tax=Branchiostoma belcheri TaxID=7741 RepID=A0A6P4YJG8_BRABE|nr:PREDICTED: protein D3-like [Branchiostoma belcheri]
MRRKPGTCPAPSPLLTRDCSRGRRNQCEGDFECPLRQKCCLDGCVKVCQNPTPRIGPGRRRPILSDRTDTEMTAEPDIAGVAAAFRQHDIVPDVVDTAPTIAAEVTYNVTDEDVSVDFGNVLTPTQVKSPPQVTWPVEDGALYTLVMTDPDAPSRANPRLREFHHWLVGNIPGNEIQDGETLSQYIGSAPPRGRGLHRYVFLVYKQPGTLEFDERRLGNTSMAHRSRFHTRVFATKYNLGDPVAGNFYQAEWDDWVPRLYAAMAQ